MNVDQLSDDLARAAARVELRAGSVTRARTEGRRRRYRRRRAGVAVTAAAAVGVTGLAIRQLSRPSPTVSSTTETVPGSTPGVAPPTSTGAAPLADLPVTEVESPFVWTRVDPDSAEAVGSSYDANLRAAETPVPGLMVSTAPGQHDDRRTLWQTADGVHWTQAGPLPTGATTAAATTRGDRVYVVGTMPGATDDTVGPVRVSISDDAGENWRGIDLPTANPGLEAVAGGRPVRTGIAGVAATDDVTLVLIRQSVDSADLSTLVDGLDLAADLAQTTPDGVAVYSCDPDPGRADGGTVPMPTVPTNNGRCPLRGEPDRVIPFAELGGAGAALQAMVAPQQRLFRSTDGATFSEVAVPATDAVYDTVLSAIGDEFVITNRNQGDGGVTSWRSADGTAWSELPAGPSSSARLGQLGAGMVSVPQVGGIAVDIDRDGSGMWRRADLTSLLGPGEAGLAMYTVAADAVGFTGAAVVGTPNPDYVEPSYSPVASTTPMATTLSTVAPVLPYSETHYDIVHTADGVSWSRESIADLAGVGPTEISAVTRIQHTLDGGVVVAVSLKAPDGEMPHQLVLVGTPKA